MTNLMARKRPNKSVAVAKPGRSAKEALRVSKTKSSKTSRNEPVHCQACAQYYKRSALVRRTERFAGMRRPGGGPNGARSNYYLCCPRGHKVIWLGFKVS